MTKRGHSDDEGDNFLPQCKWHVGVREVNATSSERMQRVYDRTRRLLVEGTKSLFRMPVNPGIDNSTLNPINSNCQSCRSLSSAHNCSFCDHFVCNSCIRNCFKCKKDFCHLCSMLRYNKQEIAICLSCC